MHSAKVLTHEQKAAVGAVALESSDFESAVDRMLRIVVRQSDEACAILFGGQPIDKRLGTLHALAKLRLRSEPRRKYLDDLIRKCRDLNWDRNAVIHGEWMPPGGFKLGWMMAPDTLNQLLPPEAAHRRSDKKVTVSRLMQLASEIRTANYLLQGFIYTSFIRGLARALRAQKS